MNEENIEKIIELILDLQYLVQELATDYLCFDHRVILFYMMDPYQVLMKITDNVLEDETLVSLVNQLKDFINYYEINEDDITLLKDNVLNLCLHLNVDIKKYEKILNIV